MANWFKAAFPVLQLQEAAEKVLLGLAELGHVHRRWSAAEHRAQRNHQDLQRIMPPGIDRPWILKSLQARSQFFHLMLYDPENLPRK